MRADGPPASVLPESLRPLADSQALEKACKEKKMSRDYGALKLWSTVLVIVGVAGVIFVGIGTIFAMIESTTFGQAIAILLIGGPLAILFASWPIALGQGLRTLADVAEYVRGQQSTVR
jgi:hypothetical protein